MTLAQQHGVTPHVIGVYRKRVRRGIKLLDEERSGWRTTMRDELIARGVKLDLTDTGTCILGLTYAREASLRASSGYDEGIKMLDLGNFRDEKFGFDTDGLEASYGILQAVWEEELIAEGIVPTTWDNLED